MLGAWRMPGRPTVEGADAVPENGLSARRRMMHIGLFGVGLLALSLAIRLVLLPYATYDYYAIGGYTGFEGWWNFIVSHGGYHALASNFSNYTVPYLYLMVVATYVTSDSLTAIKMISFVFDLM